LQTIALADYTLDKSLQGTNEEDSPFDDADADADTEDEADSAFAEDESAQDPENAPKPLNELKAELSARARVRVNATLRDSLFADPFILNTARDLGIPFDDMMRFDSQRRLVFILKAGYFPEWRARHQLSISTGFKAHEKPRKYVSEDPRGAIALKRRTAGSILTKFECHRRGSKREKKDRVPGGKSGKTRVRAKAIPCGCKSYFNAIFQPGAVAGSGKVADIYRIEYHLDHNHELGEDGSIGTLQKSKAIKDQIKSMLLGGMSITTVMNRLTMDHAKFTQLLASSDGNPRFARDDFITYDDVYNILYAITAARIRKDENPEVSAGLWMQSLKQQGYFVYYDTEHSLYHGFSSPWQLTELSKWGNVFCFDGTHHACG